MPKFPDMIPDVLFEKLRLKKQEDGFGDKPWNQWFRHLTREVSLEQSVSEILTGATRENLAMMWMDNFADNLPIMRGSPNSHKLSDVPKANKPVLIVGAGPSIRSKDHLKMLADWINEDSHRRADLVIIATDRMLIPLLKADIYPNYAITVDGNRDLIIKWYDDQIVHGTTVPGVLLSNTVAPNVAKLLTDKMVPIYWFTAMLDAFNLPTNVTRLMFYMTKGATVLNCGGNAGTAGWAAANYLQATEIALIGIDFGYEMGTPIEQTAYYGALQQILASKPEGMNEFYFDDFNPDFGVKCYSDQMFKHYKAGFQEMLTLSKIPTINCTEGGIVYGTNIRGMRFADWLAKIDHTKELEKAPQIVRIPGK